MNKRTLGFLIFITIIIAGLILVVNSDEEAKTTDNGYTIGLPSYKLGSAGALYGNNVIVSIFIDDAITSWNEEDAETIRDSLSYLGMACDYIVENAQRYNSETHFYYDYSENPELLYTTIIDDDYLSMNDCEVIYEFINENIKIDNIARKFEADNIVFLVFVNSDSNNPVTSHSYSVYEEYNEKYEVCNILMHSCAEEENPAGIAHEILHLYGAPDLYLVDEDGTNYGISEEYVKHLEQIRSNDIMFTTYDSNTNETYYDRITNEFTDLDAYYVGLTNYSEEVDIWGLGISQHERYKQ